MIDINNLYDKKFLITIVAIILDQVADLSKWSVYNDDKFNEEIGEICKLLAKIRSETEKKA